MNALSSSSSPVEPEKHTLTITAGPTELMRRATDAAHVSREIVMATANDIQGRKFVRCEGWMAIAVAHGCALTACDVEVIEGGVRAIGEVRRMADGVLIARAEGFVGQDEPTWYGGTSRVWDKRAGRHIEKDLPKRPDYAIRAMAQTRAMSRAARSAFAHVVVLIDKGLSTTPAEEVPAGGFDDPAGGFEVVTDKSAGSGAKPVGVSPSESDPWETVIHFGTNKGKTLRQLTENQREYYLDKWPREKAASGRPLSQEDARLFDAIKRMAPIPAVDNPPSNENDKHTAALERVGKAMLDSDVGEDELIAYLRNHAKRASGKPVLQGTQELHLLSASALTAIADGWEKTHLPAIRNLRPSHLN